MQSVANESARLEISNEYNTKAHNRFLSITAINVPILECYNFHVNVIDFMLCDEFAFILILKDWTLKMKWRICGSVANSRDFILDLVRPFLSSLGILFLK